MKFLLASAFGTAIGLFAQGDVGADPFPWGNLTALGIVAVVMIFIVTKMLPDLHGKFVEQSKIFAETVRESQVAFSGILDRMHERDEARETNRHDDQAATVAALTTLAAQCARHQAENRPHNPD